MNQPFHMIFALVFGVLFVSAPDHVRAMGAYHQTFSKCYIYALNQCNELIGADDVYLAQCQAIGTVFCDLLYDQTDVHSAWIALGDMASSTGSQPGGGDDDDLDFPDIIIWDLDGGDVQSGSPGDDDLDVPDIIIWDIAGGHVSQKGGDDDNIDVPDIIIWDVAGGS